MSETRSRRLERLVAQGDLEAEGKLLLERVRAGQLSSERLELLAAARVPVACRALGRPAPATGEAELEDVRRSLAGAIGVSSLRLADGSGVEALRSARLRPDGVDPQELWNVSFPRQVQALQALVLAREAELLETGWVDGAQAHSLAGGRLLVYDRDANLTGALASAASGGFFDANAMPPWDTWVAFAVDGVPPGSWRSFGTYLVAWVPPALLRAAAEGIDANPEGCIRWAEDHDGPFVERLRRAGLLGA